MSLLHPNSPDSASDANDDAARGQDYSRGSGHLIVAGLIATAAVSVGIWMFFLWGQKPPAVTGQVLAVAIQPVHTQSSGVDANGDKMAVDTYDQLMVFYRVRLHNQSKDPVYLLNATANATFASGIQSNYALKPAEYERIFHAYPKLPVAHDKGLAIDTWIEPGQTIEGSFVSIYNMTRQQWDANLGVDFTLGMRYQPNLVLAPPADPSTVR